MFKRDPISTLPSTRRFCIRRSKPLAAESKSSLIHLDSNLRFADVIPIQKKPPPSIPPTPSRPGKLPFKLPTVHLSSAPLDHIYILYPTPAKHNHSRSFSSHLHVAVIPTCIHSLEIPRGGWRYLNFWEDAGGLGKFQMDGCEMLKEFSEFM